MLAPNDPQFFEDAQWQLATKQPFWKKLFGKGAQTEALSTDLHLETDAGEGQSMDIDKAWHAIHFMLTNGQKNEKFPHCFLLDRGTSVGSADSGINFARVLNRAEVQEVDTFLDPITTEAFMEQFDPELLTKEKIYPEIWDRPDEQTECREYVQEYFETLKSFIHQAAAQKFCLLLMMN